MAAPLAASALAALLYTLACPPHDQSLLAWAVPALLLVPARRLPPSRAFVCGVSFGILIGLGVTRWALHATLEYFAFDRLSAAGFVVVVWVVCAGIPYGLLAAAYSAVARRAPLRALPVLGAWLWAACEILRANPWTGMPWELLAHTQWRSLRLLQIGELGGMYAVSFVVAVVSLAVGELVVEARGTRLGAGGWARRLALPVGLLAAVLLFGEQRRLAYAQPEDSPTRRVAVVQGSLPNAFRWKRAFFERALGAYARLTSEALSRSEAPDLVVWPENAVSFYIDGEPLLRAQIGSLASAWAVDLLVGAPRLGPEGTALNSAYLIGSGGEIRGTYDKRRLVPFAEYDPLPVWARTVQPGSRTYAAGSEAGVLPAAAFRLGTVICYEVLFPGLVREAVRSGAEVLVNLANDSWMDAGDGAAPQQHLSMSVFRAVETRRFLVRAASSGVSGFVTPYGETVALLPVAAADVAIAPVVARRGETFYVRWGEAWMLVGALGVAAALRRPGRRGAS